MKIDGLILSSGMLYTARADYISAVYKNDLYGKRAKDKEFMKYMNPENPEVMDSLPKVCLDSIFLWLNYPLYLASKQRYKRITN